MRGVATHQRTRTVPRATAGTSRFPPEIRQNSTAAPETTAANGRRLQQTMLGLTQLPNYLTLKGSFSAVSKPNFASKYAFESSRRDLHNSLFCTAFGIQNRKLGKKRPLLHSSRISIFCQNFAKNFAEFFAKLRQNYRNYQKGIAFSRLFSSIFGNIGTDLWNRKFLNE